jgi:elongation factor P hydroxylase
MSPINYTPFIELFNAEFKDSENTSIAESPDEPIYLPANETESLNQILYTAGSYTSVLHEISHWCIAGEGRRKQVDYGYWYKPDFQTPKESELYTQFEAKTHGIEWIFSLAAGVPFYIIPNNLSAGFEVSQDLKEAVYRATLNYLNKGLPISAERFKHALLKYYGREAVFKVSLFCLEAL